MMRVKGKISYVLAVLMTILGCIFIKADVYAANTYDSTAALSYAASHWNDGKGLCSEYVSNCINAGGVSAWSTSCTSLHNQLLKSGMGTEYELKLESNMLIKGSNYSDILAPGDVVFYYCSGCNDGKPYIHAVLCNGTDASGYMRAYSHNGANSGTRRYAYSSKCYACGTKIRKAYVYHFKNNTYTVEFNNDYIELQEGGKINIPFKFSGNDIYKISYSISNQNVIQTTSWGNTNWNSGTSSLNIKGIKAGSTDLYVKLLDNKNNVLHQEKVTIKVNATKKNYKLTFNQNIMYMKEGETQNAAFTFSGDGIYTMNCEVTNQAALKVASWGNIDWKNGTGSLNFQGLGAGDTEVLVKLLDRQGNVLHTGVVLVRVKAIEKTYTVKFNNSSMEIQEKEEVNIPFKFSGDDIYTLDYAISDQSIIQVTSWGSVNWNSCTGSLNIKAIKAGSTDLYVKLLDKNNKVLHQEKVAIKVNEEAKTYTLDFDQKIIYIKEGESQDATFRFSGDGIYTMSYEISNQDALRVASWGNIDWNSGSGSLNIQGLNVGDSEVWVKLLDKKGNVLHTGMVLVRIKESKKIYTLEFNNESMDIEEGKEANIPFKFSGDGIYTLDYDVSDQSIVQVTSWGSVNWNSCAGSLNIKAIRAGSVDLYVKLLDKNNKVLHQEKVAIKANATKRNYELNFSQNIMYMKEGETQNATFSFSGDGIYTMSYEISNQDALRVALWGNIDWNLGSGSLNIQGLNVGDSEVWIKLLDKQGNVLHSGMILIRIKESEKVYTLEFNNGNMDIEEGKEANIPFKFSGDGIYTLDYDVSDQSVIQVTSWGNTDWNSCKSSLNIKAIKSGSTDLYVKLLNDKYKVLYQEKITVTVSNAERIYTFDFNSDTAQIFAGSEANIGFNFSGDGIYTMQYKIGNLSLVRAVSWGNIDWSLGSGSINLQGIKEGSTWIEISLLDNNYHTLYNNRIQVNVTN